MLSLLRSAKIMEDLQLLWNTHVNAPFPAGIAGEEIEGEDLVSLDTFTAGCIDSFLANRGSLDEGRISALAKCFDGLTLVLPHLTGDAKEYYARLREMSRSTLVMLGLPEQ